MAACAAAAAVFLGAREDASCTYVWRQRLQLRPAQLVLNHSTAAAAVASNVMR
jgi:hypothetical protein